MVSLRRNVFRAGTYLLVFIEPKIQDIGFETRLQSFRENRNEESFDAVPITFGAINLICLFIFTFIGFSTPELLELKIALVVVILTATIVGNYKFSSATKLAYSTYLNIWKDIKKREDRKSKKVK